MIKILDKEAYSKIPLWSVNNKLKLNNLLYHYTWNDMFQELLANTVRNKSIEDTAENNMFFDMPWSQVTDQMIEEKAVELKENTGGWIWHQKWKGQKLPYITIERKEPGLETK